MYCRDCARETYRLGKKNDRNYQWKCTRDFGITIKDYDAMLHSQGGGCATCGARPKSERAHGRRLHIDHDHSCCPGRQSCGSCVRGLLCASCNHALGQAADDSDLLMSLASYVLQRRNVLGVSLCLS